MSDSEKLESVAGTAKRLAISVRIMRRLIRDGHVRVVRIGYGTLISESEIQRVIATDAGKYANGTMQSDQAVESLRGVRAG